MATSNNHLLLDYNLDKENCGICFDSLITKEMYITQCKHLFCTPCIKQWVENQYKQYKMATCPICRHSLDDIIDAMEFDNNGDEGERLERYYLFLEDILDEIEHDDNDESERLERFFRSLDDIIDVFDTIEHHDYNEEHERMQRLYHSFNGLLVSLNIS